MDAMMNLGKIHPAVFDYFMKLAEAYAKNYTTALQTILHWKKLKINPNIYWKHKHSVKYCSCFIPFLDSPSWKSVLEELDNFKIEKNLESRAAVLEYIIFGSGVTIRDGSMHFSLLSSNRELCAKLNEFRKLDKFCDMSIIVDGVHFGGSKAFIAASSKYLAERLDEISSELEINEMSSETFGELFDFMYSGKVALNSVNFLNIKEAACLFQLTDLLRICDVYQNIQEFATTNPNVELDLEPKNAVQGTLEEQFVEIRRTEPTSIIPLSKRIERQGNTRKNVTLEERKRKDSSDEDLSNDIEASLSDEDYNDASTTKNNKMKDISSEELVLTSPTASTEDPHGRPTSKSSELDNVWLRQKVSRRKLFACPTCKKSFSQFMTYKLHLLCHDESPIYKCFQCGFTESSTKLIEDHIKASHKDDSSSPKNVENVADAGSSTPFCVDCNMNFKSADDLRSHMKATHKKVKPTKIYPCQICHKVFQRHSHLTRHMISHSGERKHCCTTCGKLFLKSDHLKRHERTHSSERPFTCEKCGKGFRDKDHLKRHQYTHSEERPYFCEICGKQFKDKSTLLSHQKCHDPALLACKTCGKAFKTEEKLDLHMEKHSAGGVKKHACDICGKKFPVLSKLKLHMRSHTDAKPFHCETCGKQFRAFHCLRLHQKKHTGIGLHTCMECGKQFTNASHLRRHGKVHTGEKPHRCELCKKAFARSDNLEAHRRLCQVQQQMKQSLSESGGVTSPSWDAMPESREPSMMFRRTDEANSTGTERVPDNTQHTSSPPLMGRSSYFSLQPREQESALPSLVAGSSSVLNPQMRASEFMASMFPQAFQSPHSMHDPQQELSVNSKFFDQQVQSTEVETTTLPHLRNEPRATTTMSAYMQYDHI